MDFDAAFKALLGNEGGYQCDAADRGNWTGGEVGKGLLRGTCWGISAAQYPGEDILRMTPERARQLYLRDYWGPAGCDSVPGLLRFDLFDTAVHTGTVRAVMLLQEAAGVAVDGKLGPVTLQAVSTGNPWRLVARLNGARLRYAAANPQQWAAFGRGWALRIAGNLLRGD